ncbi:MAG: hypothetical protein QOC81_1951 [Thermoanaerobaculia bacterium]|nr:hypothetical protein [Thermoanaerobaculia bacterium]
MPAESAIRVTIRVRGRNRTWLSEETATQMAAGRPVLRAGSMEEVMSLTAEQKRFYENGLPLYKQEIEELNREMKDEQVKFNSRVEELTNARRATLQLY